MNRKAEKEKEKEKRNIKNKFFPPKKRISIWEVGQCGRNESSGEWEALGVIET